MYCQCGCGGITKVSTKSHTEKGWVKDTHRRFVNGHNKANYKPIRYIVNPETGCWDWLLTKTWDGYGYFTVNKKHKYAHVFYFEQVKGLVPAGLEIDHLCRNRGCVNPDHLEAVTRSVNQLRGFAARRSQCPV